jgi:hypothetical protein
MDEEIGTESSQEFEELGRIVGDTADIVVRKISFKGNQYIDIRKYFHGANYTGWSKKGISLPVVSFKEIMEILKKV